MKTVTDTNGKTYTVTEVIRGDYARLDPGHTQINLNNARAITLPNGLAERWLAGEIRVKVSE